MGGTGLKLCVFFKDHAKKYDTFSELFLRKIQISDSLMTDAAYDVYHKNNSVGDRVVHGDQEP